MMVAEYIHFISSRGLYTICIEPVGHPRYTSRCWARFRYEQEDYTIYRVYETREQALIATGMLIEEQEKEQRDGD
jgi:hypothetical protein